MNPEALQAVALAVAAETSVDRVLAQVVEGVVASTAVALARVWLIAPGDICAHVPAARGVPRSDPVPSSVGECRRAPWTAALTGPGWTERSGDFPWALRKIGRIGAQRGRLLTEDVTRDHDWIARPDWVRHEGIGSFGGQPLVFKGEILGVLGVFNRDPCDRRTLASLRRLRTTRRSRSPTPGRSADRATEGTGRTREQFSSRGRANRRRGGIVGSSPALGNVIDQVAMVAPTPASVLIQGESGTGKELVAQATHDRSPRRGRALISVNCASIPHDCSRANSSATRKGPLPGRSATARPVSGGGRRHAVSR